MQVNTGYSFQRRSLYPRPAISSRSAPEDGRKITAGTGMTASFHGPGLPVQNIRSGKFHDQVVVQPRLRPGRQREAGQLFDFPSDHLLAPFNIKNLKQRIDRYLPRPDPSSLPVSPMRDLGRHMPQVVHPAKKGKRMIRASPPSRALTGRASRPRTGHPHGHPSLRHEIRKTVRQAASA